MEAFDLEQVYDDEISPLMSKIIAICKEHKMPMIASFTFVSEEESEDCIGRCTTFLEFEHRHDKRYREARSVIKPPSVSPMKLTTISADGKAVNVTVVL